MDIWKEVLHEIEGGIEKKSFDTWFKDTTMTIDNDTMVIHIKNEFNQHWLENRYHQLISETIKEVTGKRYRIQYNSPPPNFDEDPTDDSYLSPVRAKSEQLKRIENLEIRVSRLEALL